MMLEIFPVSMKVISVQHTERKSKERIHNIKLRNEGTVTYYFIFEKKKQYLWISEVHNKEVSRVAQAV
jgi:hypothetical protein